MLLLTVIMNRDRLFIHTALQSVISLMHSHCMRLLQIMENANIFIFSPPNSG